MSAPRPYVTEPFRPLSSINNWQQFLYIQQHSSYFLHVVRSSVSCGGAHLMIADALLQKNFCLWFKSIISLVFFKMIRDGAYWHKIHHIHACAFAVQTKFGCSCEDIVRLLCFTLLQKYILHWLLLRNQKSPRGQAQGLSSVHFDPFCFCLF